jgi:hypothetical protein
MCCFCSAHTAKKVTDECCKHIGNLFLLVCCCYCNPSDYKQENSKARARNCVEDEKVTREPLISDHPLLF